MIQTFWFFFSFPSIHTVEIFFSTTVFYNALFGRKIRKELGSFLCVLLHKNRRKEGRGGLSEALYPELKRVMQHVRQIKRIETLTNLPNCQLLSCFRPKCSVHLYDNTLVNF